MQTTRVLEKIPGILTWTLLLFPLVLTPFIPEAVAVVLMLYSLFWLFQSVTYSYQLLKSYRIFRRQVQLTRLNGETKSAKETAHITKIIEEYKLTGLADTNLTLRQEQIQHLILVPTYKEPFEVLEDTFQVLCASEIDLKRVHILLACEERDVENATRISKKLEKAFGARLGSFTTTFHPKDVPGEMVGKGANITYATRHWCELMRDRLRTPEDMERFIVTTIDADHRVHKQYLHLLELYYLYTPSRQHYSFQPLPFLHNNIWQVPIFNRVVAISSMFWHLIESGRPDRLRNFSSHAQPLRALVDMNFWSITTIVEDGHQFWRSYIHFLGGYKVIPLFIPIYQDAVQHTTYASTLVAQYKQLRRWAYGAEDIAFTLIEFWQHKKELPKLRSLYLFLNLLEGHIMWATAPVLLSMTSMTFKIFNPVFTSTAMYYNLSLILSTFFSISMMGIVVSIWMSFILLPKVPREEGPWHLRVYLWLSLALQWFLLPITTLFFSGLPALEAQTRLIFGNKLHFDVTLKIRKH